jgi:hypothetical protein
MKPDPIFIYPNYYQEICPQLYHRNGKKLVFNHLKCKITPGEYMFVIRELEPNRIYIHKIDNHVFFNACGKEIVVHHNCLALDRRVISAGSITFIKGKRAVITNCSGHYFPSYESLSYLNYLLSNLGYIVIDTYEF